MFNNTVVASDLMRRAALQDDPQMEKWFYDLMREIHDGTVYAVPTRYVQHEDSYFDYMFVFDFDAMHNYTIFSNDWLRRKEFSTLEAIPGWRSSDLLTFDVYNNTSWFWERGYEIYRTPEEFIVSVSASYDNFLFDMNGTTNYVNAALDSFPDSIGDER
jgi:hypothetical protein